MSQRKDLTGQRFGRLVVERMAWRKGRHALAHCRCVCGKTKTVAAPNLCNGTTTSCGCFQKEQTSKAKRKDLTGHRFGKLVVECMDWRNQQGYAFCRCDCGNSKTIQAHKLGRGHTQSCGCWRAESARQRRRKDLTGQRFGRLVVKRMTWVGERKERGHATCLCDCGTTVKVVGTSLTDGQTQSCGCWQREQRGKFKRKDLTGQRFGRVVVERMTWTGKGDSRSTALIRCDCGVTKSVKANALVQGKVQSCGCSRLRTPEEKQARARLHRHTRRARVRGLPHHFTRDHEIFMMDYWHNRCAVCGTAADFWRVIAWDHWIAVSDPACLGTVPGNILPLCHATKGARGGGGGPLACNSSKWKNDPVAWLLKRLGPRKGKAKLRQIERYFAAATALAIEEIAS